jgi:hypothetical protein
MQLSSKNMNEGRTQYTDPFRAKLILSAALLSLVTSAGVALALVYIRNWFGASDYWAFLFWTIPYSSLLGAFSTKIRNLCCELRFAFRLSFAVAAGLISGLVWTIIVFFLLGPWFGAFSFPVLYGWLVGGVAGMVTIVGSCSEQTAGEFLSEVATVTILALVAFTL